MVVSVLGFISFKYIRKKIRPTNVSFFRFLYDVVLYLVLVSLLRPPSTLPRSTEVFEGCDDNDNDDKFAKKLQLKEYRDRCNIA